MAVRVERDARRRAHRLPGGQCHGCGSDDVVEFGCSLRHEQRGIRWALRQERCSEQNDDDADCSLSHVSLRALQSTRTRRPGPVLGPGRFPLFDLNATTGSTRAARQAGCRDGDGCRDDEDHGNRMNVRGRAAHANSNVVIYRVSAAAATSPIAATDQRQLRRVTEHEAHDIGRPQHPSRYARRTLLCAVWTEYASTPNTPTIASPSANAANVPTSTARKRGRACFGGDDIDRPHARDRPLLVDARDRGTHGRKQCLGGPLSGLTMRDAVYHEFCAIGT